MNYQDKSYIDSKIRNLRCTLEKKIKNIDGGGGGETPSEAAYIPLKGTETETYIDGYFNVGESQDGGFTQSYMRLKDFGFYYNFATQGSIGSIQADRNRFTYENIFGDTGVNTSFEIIPQGLNFTHQDENLLKHVQLYAGYNSIMFSIYDESNGFYNSQIEMSAKEGISIHVEDETKGMYGSKIFEPVTETHFLQRAHLTELESALSPLAFSGDYEDLTNAPSIPAAQVQSNWNSTSGMSQILNKPTLSTVATSGSYADLTNKPTIPAAQVQPNWTASSGMGQILNKQTLTTVATSGDYNDLINKPSIPNIPSAPVTGTFILKSIEGVIQWVEEV